MTGLRLLRPDLPPKWDGHDVTWQAWEFLPPAFFCAPDVTDVAEVVTDPNVLAFFDEPLPRGVIERRCCVCDSDAQPRHSAGMIHPLPGEMFASTVRKRGRFGRDVYLPRLVPAWPLRAIAAFRCVQCAHDDVVTLGADELGITDATWCLDDTDYGPDGSVAP